VVWYLVITLSIPACGMGSCSMFWDFPAWLKIVDLVSTTDCTFICRSLLGPLPQSPHKEKGVLEGPPLQLLEPFILPRW
jgi:hypothetical protein